MRVCVCVCVSVCVCVIVCVCVYRSMQTHVLVMILGIMMNVCANADVCRRECGRHDTTHKSPVFILHIHECLYIRTCIHTYRQTCIHENMQPYTFTREAELADLYTYMYTYMHTYKHTYIHTNKRSDMHTYIHTYIHTTVNGALYNITSVSTYT